LIRQRSDELVQAAQSPYVILAVPLLIESGNYAKRCQRILVIDCPEELQIERVMARNGIAAEQVRAIMATQVTREARLAAADDVIDNSLDQAHLHREVEALHLRYLQFAAAGG